MRKSFACLGLAFCLALPGFGQTLLERLKDQHRTWEGLLDKGEALPVRRAVESLIQREAAQVNPQDYNEMRALVGLYDLAARACVLEGAWEDAIAHLQKALEVSTQNHQQAEGTFGRIRKEHEAKLPGWRDIVTAKEKVLKEMDEAPGLTREQLLERNAVRATLDEHRSAIAHSERSLKEMDGVQDQLRQTREAFAKSLTAWQGFLAQEKQEMAQAGSTSRYVVEKLDQVKADEAKPRFERLAYGRRLLRLDGSNKECRAFVGSLAGAEPEAEAQPAPAAKAKPKGKSARKGRK